MSIQLVYNLLNYYLIFNFIFLYMYKFYIFYFKTRDSCNINKFIICYDIRLVLFIMTVGRFVKFLCNFNRSLFIWILSLQSHLFSTMIWYYIILFNSQCSMFRRNDNQIIYHMQCNICKNNYLFFLFFLYLFKYF